MTDNLDNGVSRGEKLLLMRRKYRVHQMQLAKQLGLYSETIRDIETGAIVVTQAEYERITSKILEMANEQ
jgi:DNA-binding XRE family transcriptional regulator